MIYFRYYELFTPPKDDLSELELDKPDSNSAVFNNIGWEQSQPEFDYKDFNRQPDLLD